MAAGLGAFLTADLIGNVRGLGEAGAAKEVQDRTVHVAASGDDANVGSSPMSPMRTIAAALRSLSGGPGTVSLRAGDAFPTSETLTLDVARHRIIGEGSIIVADALPTGAAVVHLVASDPQPLLQPWTVLDGVRIRGAGRNVDCIGLLLDQPSTPGKAAVAHVTARSVAIDECGVGVRFGDNTYCVTFSGCVVAKCGVAVLVSDGTTNAGERLHFDGCTVFDSDTGIQVQSRAAEITMVGSSLDYCTRLLDISEGRVHLLGCHLEFDKSSDVEPMRVSGRTGGFAMIGGKLTATTRDELTVPAVVRNDADPVASSSFSGVYMTNLSTASGDLSTGDGATIVQGEVTDVAPHRSFTVVGDTANLLVDGGFQRVELVDLWLSETPEGARGSSEVLSIGDGVDGETRELRVSASDSGQDTTVSVAVPIPPASLPRGRLRFRPRSGSGAIQIAFLAGVVRREAIVESVELGAQFSESFSSARQEWTIIRSPLPIVRAPVWATHLLVRIAVVDATADASIAIADVNLCAT